MIFGDKLAVTQKGIFVSNKSMETIGIFPETQVFLLPFRTFEYRDDEPGKDFPNDLLLTPIRPRAWPFVIRFVLRLRNKSEMLERAVEFFRQREINILFAECSRSGHHHSVLNILGEVKRLEYFTISQLMNALRAGFKGREEFINKIEDSKSKEFNLRANYEPAWYTYLKHVYLLHEMKKLGTDPSTNQKNIEDFLKKIDYKISFRNKYIEKKNSRRKKSFVSQWRLNKLACCDEILKLVIEIEKEDYIEAKRKLIEKNLGTNRDSLENDIEKLKEEQTESNKSIENLYENKKTELQTEGSKEKDELKKCKDRLEAIELELSKKTVLLDQLEQEWNKGIEKYRQNCAHARNFFENFFGEKGCISFEMPLIEIFDHLLKKIRPEIKKLEEQRLHERLTNKQLYEKVESEIEPLKMLLKAVTTLKRILCDQFKIQILMDALRDVNPDTPNIVPYSMYLYNVRYYQYHLTHPQFSGYSDFRFSYWSAHEKKNSNTIAKKLLSLPKERNAEWRSETRHDLDPIVISPVEFLCHAFYHCAYEENFEIQATNELLPFPKNSDFFNRILGGVLPKSNSATLAIASRNTEDLTLRLCPLPTAKIGQFLTIEMEDYLRSCNDSCGSIGGSQFRTNSYEGIVNPDPDYSTCITSQKKCAIQSDENSSDKNTNSSNDKLYTSDECLASSMGLMHLFLGAISNYERNNFNIWRAYNKTNQSSHKTESGSIHLIVQAQEKNFREFEKQIGSNLESIVRCSIDHTPSLKHVKAGKIKINKLSGGQIFLSFPFHHPMKNTWIQSIRRIGRKMGFSKILPAETYTDGVTKNVSDVLKNSHAMLQIMAIPIEDPNGPEPNDLTWLHAEYLAAQTLGLPVIRIVDKCSIKHWNQRIGRDHASIFFSVTHSVKEFEKAVKDSFLYLRKELGDVLGLS